jgi:hypothetical protein
MTERAAPRTMPRLGEHVPRHLLDRAASLDGPARDWAQSQGKFSTAPRQEDRVFADVPKERAPIGQIIDRDPLRQIETAAFDCVEPMEFLRNPARPPYAGAAWQVFLQPSRNR